MVNGIPSVSPHQLPDRFRHVFPYDLFNAVQSKCFGPIYNSNDNVVVSSPTGSGKTVLLELAICRLVENHQSGQFKIVYQAPTKSLCSERLHDWEKKFSHLNLACAELTGDTHQAEMTRVRNASIIVTTPEKWDSITRKWTDHAKLVQMVKLFLIDEVHILKDTRGATLEAVVSRMKSMGTDVRVIAISATVPNSPDIARWLGKDPINQHLPAHREAFGEEYRPVKLVKWVRGFDGSLNEFQFDKTLDGKLPAVVQQYSEKKPIMVFCFTRKSCESTARILAEHWTRQHAADRAWPAPPKKTAVRNGEHQQLVNCGVAFHHAGIDSQDRHAIETAYLNGNISVICCTSTLAVGVNLPCHLVILKGTSGYQEGGKLCDYSDLDVMQMLGRAGRPQFDSKAVAVIMTHSNKAKQYEKMLSGQQILESTLHLNLIEHLNSEISLGTIKDLSQAKKWIQGTFLAVRMRQNPDHYKMKDVADGWNIEKRLELVCERDIKLLQEHGLVGIGERFFSCTEYGQAMSRYMVQFETMKEILNIPRLAKMEQILQTISQAAEFQDLRIKIKERKVLREWFNKSPFIKFPVQGTFSLTSQKVALMLQIQLGGVELPQDNTEFNMIRRQFNIETTIIFERVQRLIRCVIDCKASDSDSVAVRHALDLARSFSAQFWENSNLQLRQIPQIGPVGHRKLVDSNIDTVQKLAEAETGRIEAILSKAPTFGQKMKELLAGFPRLILTADITGQTTVRRGQSPKVNVRAELGYSNEKIPVWSNRKPSVTFMAETTDGTLVHFWRGNITQMAKRLELKFTVELSGHAEQIKCWIACDEIVGTVKTCVLEPNIPASAFPPPAPKPTPKAAVSPKVVAQVVPKAIPRGKSDEFGTDELSDDEMLAAADEVEYKKYLLSKIDSKVGIVNRDYPPYQSLQDYKQDTEHFDDIDDLDGKTKAVKDKKNTQRVDEEEDSKDDDIIQSVQMANGRWTCQHVCRDGRVLKTGEPCKHRCCKEGLEKPRPQARKDPSVQGAKPAAAKKIKSSQGSSAPKLKESSFDVNDISDAELVDLTEVRAPATATYGKTAPRDHQNFHDHYTKGQLDVPTLPKTKPQLSSSSGEKPGLSFFQQQDDLRGLFDSLEPEKPNGFEPIRSLHDDMARFDEAYFEQTPEDDYEVSPSSLHDDTMHGFEAGMSLFISPQVPLHAPQDSVPDVSFSNDLFDFNTYEGMMDIDHEHSDKASTDQLKGGQSSSPAVRNPPQRQLSTEDAKPAAKRLRLSNAELVEELSQPEWTNEVDQGLIDSLKNFVDFE
ncbi:P-loop containing nucleoside triphosphate hydrolase protein [Mollisia scopiformis]|uniref:DNA 3'-5' helicase n=1 Tax=Mollisia scopiformis TaxID=149040 RepID=A0A194XQ96_MOLSC|nr:P-loop containing nucleoside triphosphate hydrolase protein [Mollisia scopiformis]KUJ21917.1 P-loop containing nucleoside triphosphate hydrolase protein [Mollisia scopiformis]